MRIRELSEADLTAIVDIQTKTPQAAQWIERDYTTLARDPLGLVLVAEVDTTIPPEIVGFAAFHRVLDEAELRNISVDPAYQRQGVGRELLAAARPRLLAEGVRHVYLDVRASNVSAQQLYYSAGFVLNTRRKDYYNNPAEDALLLRLDLSSPLEPSGTSLD